MWPRLLVVDDEPAICDLISDVARGLGFLCDQASTAQEVDMMLGAGHDVTVIDLTLVGIDGVTVMRTLSSRSPGAQILLASGASERIVASARRVAELYGLQVLGVCLKPLRLDQLRSVLADGMRMARILPTTIPTNELSELVRDLQFTDLRVVYQPIMDLRDSSLVGAEALVRWTHPLRGPVPPAEFVPELERLGLSRYLLLQVARTAAGDRAEFSTLGNLTELSLNVSATDLLVTGVPDELQQILTCDSLASAWVLEITETFADRVTVNALAAMTRLGLMEFNLAIDDYGTGSSNLERLRSYPFTSLKIDRSFISEHGLPKTSDWYIIESAIKLGHDFGLTVVAEGVEDLAVFHRLRDLGCDRVQGYLISKPLPAAEFQAKYSDPAMIKAAARILGMS